MRPNYRHLFSMIKGAALVSAGSLINAASGFFAQTIVANGVSPKDFGIFMTSLAGVNIFAPIAAFGAPQFMLKVFGKDSANFGRWVAAIKSFVISSSIVALVVAAFWGVALANAAQEQISLRLLPAVVATSACSIMVVMAQIKGKFTAVMFWQAAQNVFRLALVGVLFLWFQPALAGFADAYGAAAILVIIVAYPIFREYEKSHLAPSSRLPGIKQKAIIRQTWVYAAEGFIYLAYYNAPLLLIGVVAGPAASGFYAIGAAIMTASYLIPAAIFQRFFLARLHRAAYHDEVYFSFFLHRGVVASGVLGLAACGILFFAAEPMVKILYGESYGESAKILKILYFSLPFRFAAYAPDSMLATGGRQAIKLKLMVIMAVICAILVALLSVLAGAMGGAMAYVAAEILFFSIMYLFASRRSELREKKLA